MSKRLLGITFCFYLFIVTTVSAELDLREANVTNVTYEQNGLQIEFDVTLLHDDDGEAPNYADLWVVEDIEGNELVRRELLHSHGTVEFTRSASGVIAEGITKLVVRGYDQIHEWGGQVALIDTVADLTTFVNQGEERREFSEADFAISQNIVGESFTQDTELYLLVFIGLVSIPILKTVSRKSTLIS